ncbi:MAG: hypothetical protein U0641_02770 [Anaerolineae bacterium]
MTNAYGPRMLVKRPDGARLVRAAWPSPTRRSKSGAMAAEQLRDYNYVDDAVEALLLAAHYELRQRARLQPRRAVPVRHLELVETLVSVAGSGRFRLKPSRRARQD